LFFGVLEDEQKAHFNNYHKIKIIITNKNQHRKRDLFLVVAQNPSDVPEYH
jgi:hypothetical protein